MMGQVIGQNRQIEGGSPDARTRHLGIDSIAELLKMGGNHERRFVEIKGFAHRLEARRSYQGAAIGHHFQKFFSVQLMKRQRGIYLLFLLLTAFIVVKTMECHRLILGVPRLHLSHQMRIIDVHQQIVLKRRRGIFYFLAQQWRRYKNPSVGLVGHGSERQRQ